MKWSQLDRRRQALAAVVAAAALLAIGGWIASLLITSPREAAANASAPAPSLITVPVAMRQVGDELVTRGLVTASQTVEAINPLAGKGASRVLISGHLPKVGTKVRSGEVVVEISGRPIIALQGDVPAYRDLAPGATGPDVRQLNAALAAAGLGTDKSSSDYSQATQDAVTGIYRRAGYSSNGSLPVSEVVFVAALPASIVKVEGSLGADASSSSIQVASGDFTVTADFPSAQAALIQPGAKVVISSEILGKTANATVKAAATESSAGSSSGTADQSAPSGGDSPATDAGSGTDQPSGQSGDTAPTDTPGQASYTIVPDSPLGSDWAGQDVKVRVVSASTTGKVLAVPVTAIVADGSGQTEVVVVDKSATTIADAHPRRVPVTVGVSGNGWVQVTPASGQHLSEGDPVQLSAAPTNGASSQ